MQNPCPISCGKQLMPTIEKSFLIFALVFLLVGFAGVGNMVHAQQLNNDQIRSLNSANSQLDRLVVNYNLALQSAGTGTARPTGAKAKLTQVRLNQAIESAKKVQSLLGKLPADNVNVQATQESLNDAVAAINSLDERLNGKPAEAEKQAQPSTGPPMKTEQAAQPESTSDSTPEQAAVKLDYKQVELLKNARFHLRTVEGGSQQLVVVLEEINKNEVPENVDYRVVRKALAVLEEATRKAGFCNDNLQKIPANGEGVSEVASRLQQANRKLEVAKKSLVPLNEMLTRLINPASYPNLRADLKRLNELSQMFRDSGCFVNNPPRAAAVWQQMDPAAEEGTRIASVYQRLIQQQTEEGKRFAGGRKGLADGQAAFRVAAEKQDQALPEEIQGMFGKVRETASRAVENKKPLFFTMGIPQQLGFVQQKLDLLKAINESTSKPLFAELETLHGELKKQQQSLASLIIEQNALPNDQFQGGDRQKAIDVAIDGWKYQQKEFDLLGTRVPAESWARETRWEYSNSSWYFVDRSKLQVILLVADKENGDLAIKRPVTVIKDHQKGDAMIGVPFYAGDDELLPNAYMLKSKVK